MFRLRSLGSVLELQQANAGAEAGAQLWQGNFVGKSTQDWTQLNYMFQGRGQPSELRIKWVSFIISKTGLGVGKWLSYNLLCKHGDPSSSPQNPHKARESSTFVISVLLWDRDRRFPKNSWWKVRTSWSLSEVLRPLCSHTHNSAHTDTKVLPRILS